MRTTFLDFETYYDDEYSLRKMTPVEYVLDPRFECHGCAVKHELTGKSYWIDGEDLPAFFATLEPSETILVTHNALFDMCIVAWIYGFVPRLMVDTMGVAQAVLGHVLRSVSLNSTAMHLCLGAKTGALVKVKGLPMEVIKQTPALYNEYTIYGCQDVDLCAGIYEKLVVSGKFPMRELVIMDMILRCAIEPKFKLDPMALAEHLHAVRTEKELLLTNAMLCGAEGKTALRSNDKFAELLRAQGVEPPTKVSPVTGKTAYAFAKSDVDFMALTEHDNPAVQTLVEARLGSKSTIEESRTERLMSIANLVWSDVSGLTSEGNQPAWIPVPLKFSGAHTHRFSGQWALNLQNLPTRGGRNQIRRALIAPPGYTVVTVDASQIQARLVAWICRQMDLLAQFAAGEDVYSTFASGVFGYPVTKANKVERFVGKTGILGLGFGVGWAKFQSAVKLQSKEQLGVEVDLSDEEALNIVTHYRTSMHRIPATWKSLQYQGIPVLANGGSYEIGPCVFEKGAINLPSGLQLHYHDLQNTTDGWEFTFGGKPKRTYGGHLLENLAQALERVLVMEAAIRIQNHPMRPCPIELALQAHDELVYVVPTQHVKLVRQICEEEMRRRPSWGLDLPLDAESGEGPTYGDAK
jgi:hypothetical protein